MNERIRSLIKFVRLFIALLLLAGLFYLVGAAELLSVFFRLRWLYVFYLIVLGTVGIWLSCLKWRLFIRAGGNDVPLGRLMQIYTISYFFNTLAPSVIGGDLARSFHLGRYVDNQRDAFVATFLERFSGLFAMAFLGVFFVLIGASATAGLSVAVLSVGFVVFAATAACFIEPFRRFSFTVLRWMASPLGQGIIGSKLRRLLDKVDEGMALVRADFRLFFNAFLLSLAFHTFTVINTYVAALAVGWEHPDFFGLFVIVPLVLLVSMAPITPNGLGVQEGAFFFFLQRIGGTSAECLAVPLVLRAKTMLAAISGGLLWLKIRKEPKGAGRKELYVQQQA